MDIKEDFAVEFKWCCRDYCYDHQTFMLKYGEVASLDNERALSDLGDLGGYHAKSGVCNNLEAVILWDNAVLLPPICPYAHKARYVAEVSEQSVLIDEIQGAFPLTSRRKLQAAFLRMPL